MQLWSISTNLLHHPIPVVEILKNPDPAMLEFSSPAILGVPEPSQNRQISERLTLKISTPTQN